ncbi:hypothetical protein DE146DRAFT_621455 [Phaeosphaeria sp. MPI-PUGE-AT-0046c]|nr:hypothetical protein DE146DRAFT_621455 [Phaeosphaeria sp. MPI-PUGE-AT-0046c]
MAGVLCVWAKIPDEVLDWYENEFLPARRAQNAIHTLHCGLTPSGFEGEPIGKLDAPWPLCAIYEVADIEAATRSCYDKTNHPPEHLWEGPLANARFDTRTYRQLKCWINEDWDGAPQISCTDLTFADMSQVASVAAMEWRVTQEMKEEIISWYTSYVGPLISSSPDIIRFRLFEVDNATVLQGESYETKEKDSLHTYFTMVELETEEWPWDVVLELAENEKWKQYFEAQREVKWQLSHYLVKRLYSEKDDVVTVEKDKPKGQA